MRRAQPAVQVKGFSKRKSPNFLLTERVKELNCLYNVSRAFEQGSGDLPRALQMVCEALPSAWQHSEVAVARITYRGSEYTTSGFRITPWMQESPIVVDGKIEGSVTVCYLEERPECGEGPFLIEERTLINVIAQRLGIFIEREMAREKLMKYQEDLRSLAAKLALSEQQERRRLAEMLHDRIGQNLAVVAFRVAQLRQSSENPDLRDALAEIQEVVQGVIADTRSLTYELCPPILYELGLGPAIEWLAEETERRFGLAVGVTVRGPVEPLGEELRITLFQAVRELLTNVAKHAGATAAQVNVTADESRVRVSVSDDGVGMDPAALTGENTERLSGSKGGFGLFNIKERLSWLGGHLAVSSRPGSGTLVVLDVPRQKVSPHTAQPSGAPRTDGGEP